MCDEAMQIIHQLQRDKAKLKKENDDLYKIIETTILDILDLKEEYFAEENSRLYYIYINKNKLVKRLQLTMKHIGKVIDER
jgi:cell division protein FtsB